MYFTWRHTDLLHRKTMMKGFYTESQMKHNRKMEFLQVVSG